MKEISVLVPAYNEEKLLKETVLELDKYLKEIELNSYEIIICVNGSTDDTEKIAQELSYNLKNVIYTTTTKKGFGEGLKQGINAASKEIITFVSADNEINPKFIQESLELMKDYDFLSGSRFLAKQAHGSSSLRSFLSKSFALTTKICISTKLTEIGTIKVFKKKWAKQVLPKIKSSDFGIQIELIYHAIINKLKIKELPVKIKIRRESQDSKVNILKETSSLLKILIIYGSKIKARKILGFFTY